eukprot:12641680-Alexandrium_andersonii.AAC.1
MYWDPPSCLRLVVVPVAVVPGGLFVVRAVVRLVVVTVVRVAYVPNARWQMAPSGRPKTPKSA